MTVTYHHSRRPVTPADPRCPMLDQAGKPCANGARHQATLADGRDVLVCGIHQNALRVDATRYTVVERLLALAQRAPELPPEPAPAHPTSPQLTLRFA